MGGGKIGRVCCAKVTVTCEELLELPSLGDSDGQKFQESQKEAPVLSK